MLVTLAMAFAGIHALAFLFMRDSVFTAASLVIPFHTGKLGEATGIVAFELMVAVVVSTVLQRLLNHRRWLWLHRMAYPALGLTVVHSFVGALIDGHLAGLWLAGLAFLVPTVMLAALRFVPPRALAGIGLVRAES